MIQTALYIDFAWVFYTRQRVKLRGGGIVDLSDFRRGVVLGRLLGTDRAGQVEDEEAVREGESDEEEGNAEQPLSAQTTNSTGTAARSGAGKGENEGETLFRLEDEDQDSPQLGPLGLYRREAGQQPH